MSLTLGLNIASLQAQRRLANGQEGLSQVFERLSSGQRINRASDDAAGLAIADSLRADARIFQQGVRNLNDGVSLFNIVDSALEELTSIVERLQELSAQAANGSYSDDQRAVLDQEAQSLSDEYSRIIQSVEFNDMSLLNGDTQSISLQGGIGTNGMLSGAIGGAIGTGEFANDFSAISDGLVAIDTGDVNGDGNIDAVAVTLSGKQVYLGTGSGGFTEGELADSNVSTVLYLQDVNDDGNLDLIGMWSNSIVTQLGNGDGSFQSRITSTANNQVGELTFGDFNGDGVIDVVNGYGTRTELLLGNNDGTFETSWDQLSVTSAHVASGDINGDGIDDLIAGSTGLGYRVSNGDGTFSSQTLANGVDSFQDVELTDLNNDGNLDIIGVNSTDNALSVFLGDGAGGFSSEVQYGGANSPIAVEAGDLNGDGIADLVLTDYGDNALHVLLGAGDGTFGSQTTLFRSGPAAQELALEDFNNDGVLDALAGYSGFSVHLGETKDGVAPLLPFTLETKVDAKEALSRFTQKREHLSEQRGEIGAFQSRLYHATSVLSSTAENLLAAESSIRDVDFAKETAELVRLQILQQAGTSVLAQANIQPKIALSLLQTF